MDIERYYIGLAIVVLLAGWFYARALKAESKVKELREQIRNFQGSINHLPLPVTYSHRAVDRLLDDILVDNQATNKRHFTAIDLLKYDMDLYGEDFVRWLSKATLEWRKAEVLKYNYSEGENKGDLSIDCSCCHH